MWILFELASSRASGYLYEYDCMGCADNEQDAMDWVAENPEYRAYKYCPNKFII